MLERSYRFFWRHKGDVYHVLWDLCRCGPVPAAACQLSENMASMPGSASRLCMHVSPAAWLGTGMASSTNLRLASDNPAVSAWLEASGWAFISGLPRCPSGRVWVQV